MGNSELGIPLLWAYQHYCRDAALYTCMVRFRAKVRFGVPVCYVVALLLETRGEVGLMGFVPTPSTVVCTGT